MDIARWGLGVTYPTRAMSMGAKFMFDDDQETPNTMETSLWFPEEKKMLVFAVRHWITNHEGMGSGGSNAVGVTFYGSKGYLVIPSYTSWHSFLGKERKEGPKGSGGEQHYKNFVDAVRSRKREDLAAEIEEGHISAALCHLANVSCRVGRSLEFDPKTETIRGDEEANRLLTREYRAPFVVPEKV
ncbi:MAG: gfo/Idh/MocA family oxidoreductase, partial [Planctomycetes bacterium]|nr:gfo/Idh/MocA family oxidoreductase [Planctomycetota bacterium]